jgi:hypothetical protein
MKGLDTGFTFVLVFILVQIFWLTIFLNKMFDEGFGFTEGAWQWVGMG